MSKVGGDIEQLAQLKQTFDRESQNVAELTSTISNTITNTWWLGPHAERFRADWQGQYQPMLTRLQEALQQLGVDVDMKRQQLEQAGA